ncbi:aldose 1-epimerase [Zobellia galactanivorans]|uniref:Aldose 1-epimerase n=1 Tax=Zobellia galactanivorans (strain DSM 12802 / CCUG 47099 / CIP 106680 / NCIMB 13871 / Dsij) TaxID=63186 RepID=G0L979_ZOBGA|nr:aldose 1-epimerase [Zobellia galactanivorans]CAZ94395.1 Aldose 1-epimerase [Zobellia galactanivorans]
MAHRKNDIRRTQIDGHTILECIDSETDHSFSVIPDYGGSLNSFVCKGEEVLLGARNEKDFQEFTVNSYAGAQLFPYPNRIKGGNYTFDGEEFSLPLNDHPYKNALHGLIYNRPFKVVDIAASHGRVKLEYRYQHDHGGYPFDLLLSNTYRLSGNTLSIYTVIENLGSDTAPVGHGWHPYFMAPEKADVYSLEMEQQGYYVIDHDLIPTGELVDTFIASDLKPIGSTELNHCFALEKGKASKVKLINSINGREVEISTKGYPYMQVYIPPNRNCIALEPCTCIPNAFNNQVGSRYLEPSEVWELQFDITIKA